MQYTGNFTRNAGGTIVADDVMPMIAMGAARLRAIVFGQRRNEGSKSGGKSMDEDLSVDHVAVLGEN